MSAIEIAAIIQALVVKAMSGDVQAAKVVLSYTIGKPEPAKDPDRTLQALAWDGTQSTAGPTANVGLD